MNEQVRTAVIGYGLAGSLLHAPLIASTPGMSVSAIVTGSPERRRQAARDFPQARLLSGPEELWREAAGYDLAVVATPPGTHAELAIAALERGLNVVVEKPAAVSSAQLEHLLAAAARSGRLLTVYQNRRWDGDFLTVRRLVESDALSTLVRMESRFEQWRPTLVESWKDHTPAAEGGGVLLDLGSHLVDQAIQLFGPPSSVYAELASVRPAAVTEDDAFISLRFATRPELHVQLWASLLAAARGPRFRLAGLGGGFTYYGLDPQPEALRAGLRPGTPEWESGLAARVGELITDDARGTEPGSLPLERGSYAEFYRLLVRALRNGAPAPVDPFDALLVMRVLEACRESSRQGRALQLTEAGQLCPDSSPIPGGIAKPTN